MSKDNDLSFVERMVKQGSHKLTELAADVVGNNPKIRKLIEKYDPSGKKVANAIRYGFGALNLKNPLIEDVIHSMGSELASIIEKWGPATTEEEKRQTSAEAIAKAQKKVEDLMAIKVRTVGNLFTRSECAHLPPPFQKKGEKAQADMTVADALEMGYIPSSCGCFTKYHLVQTPSVAASPESDVENVPSTSVVNGPTLLEHLKKFQDKYPDKYQDVVLNNYRVLTARDASLKGKFLQAFHGRDNYDTFEFILLKPSGEWLAWLDDFLGKSDAPPEKKVGVLQGLKESLSEFFGEAGTREREETNQVIDSVGNGLTKIEDKLKGFVGAKKEPTEEEKKQKQNLNTWIEGREKARAERRKAREAGGFGKLVGLLVPIALFIAALAALSVI